MKIYTKTGDDGTTGLLGGSRIGKCSVRIRAIGEVDELNSAIGAARQYSSDDPLDVLLHSIQNWLFDLGSELAGPPGGKYELARIGTHQTRVLEESMDAQSKKLPALKAFILPGGAPLAAHLHLARSVCRRAERAVAELHELEAVRGESRALLNRLSDWLFVSARTANHTRNVNDIEWKQSEAP